MKTQAIIPTAGVGSRIKSTVIKSLLKVNGKPLFVYALQVFERCPSVDSVILVVHRQHLKEFEKNVKKYGLSKVRKIVIGGATRRESVKNAIAVLDPDTDIVLVHDGVRPLVSVALVENAVRACKRSGAVIAAMPAKATMKRVNLKDMTVRGTIPRREMWEVQTPQVFKRAILEKAHRRAGGQDATDDALLVEKIGVPVKVIEGSYRNIKVTTREDLLFVKHLIRRQ